MCGITGYFARESVPSQEVILNLLKYGEMRGTDAVGYVVASKNGNPFYEIVDSQKEIGKGNLEELSECVNGMKVGDIVVMNNRATPETEPDSIDNASIQPIIDEDNGIILVHNGSVSNFIVESFKRVGRVKPCSDLDSEAIIWSYLYHGRNMKRTMEYLSGGFAFLMIDCNKEKLYVVASHNPLYAGYVKGHGMFFSSIKEGIFSTISLLKGMTIDRNNTNIWEDYYCQEIPTNTISEIDLISGARNEWKFIPRYIHPKYDPIKHRSKQQKVLVAASGGLDSSTTLAVLKESGYDVSAVHFQYGHRGQQAERLAIDKVCNSLGIEQYNFSIEDNMKILDTDSMLTDKDHKITTGTSKGLKSTVAWTCFRNGLFMSYMGALAESMIINKGYGEVFLTGGFMNLTESGCFVDCDDNPITTYDNKQVLPSEVKLNDELLSFNFDLRKLEKTYVKRIFKPIHNKTYIIHLKYEEGAVYGQKSLRVSHEQPFYIKSKGWCQSSDLKIGNILYSYKECSASTKSITSNLGSLKTSGMKGKNHPANITKYGWEVTKIDIINGEQPMLDFHCEPNNNFFINKILSHNSYPDNSERFINSFIKFAEFASITGTKIKPLYACANLLKTDQYVLLDKLGWLDELSPYLVSCDRPIVVDGVAHNCSKDGFPACGSGAMSAWACQRLGYKDKRTYYEVDDPSYEVYKPKISKIRIPNIEDILKRLQIHPINMRVLQRKLL